MSAQSLFSKKNIASQQPTETHRGLLDELSLPPQFISFMRKNARSLQIGLIIVVVLVLGWVFYNYYTELQENKGASLLTSAMQTESAEQQVQILESVIKDYSRTDAARWSKLELAHLDFEAGSFDAAAVKYKEILDSLSSGNPLAPLTRLNLAQSYEEAVQYDQAIAQYTLLKKTSGFENEAYLGLGRIFIAKDEPAQARSAYEELLSVLGDDADPRFKSKVQANLAALDEGKTVTESQPDENKE